MVLQAQYPKSGGDVLCLTACVMASDSYKKRLAAANRRSKQHAYVVVDAQRVGRAHSVVVLLKLVPALRPLQSGGCNNSKRAHPATQTPHNESRLCPRAY